MMAPRIAGFRCCHSASPLVTAMKSEPRKTPATPLMSKSRMASGEAAASDLARKSTVPLPSTSRPGRNLSVAGLGVGSVWMNMRAPFQSGSKENGKADRDGVLIDGVGGVKSLVPRLGLPDGGLGRELKRQ